MILVDQPGTNRVSGEGGTTHRNQYPGGKYLYVSSMVPGQRGYILVILDVSDPRHPKEAGRLSLPSQDEKTPPSERAASYHGPTIVSPDGKSAALGFSPYVMNIDISDVTQPKVVGKVQITPPFIDTPGSPQAVHTVIPLWDRKLLYANSEAWAENCDDDALNFVGLFDNKNPANPRLISTFPVPRPPAGAPYRNFCQKGGRFGPHNVSTEIHSPDVEKWGDLVYLTYFNAGLRVFDIKDPRQPTEVGWFIPPTPPKRVGPLPRTALVTQTNDVLADARGYIYITDRQWGVWILKYTGSGQPAPTAR